jgi:hypothetical protein
MTIGLLSRACMPGLALAFVAATAPAMQAKADTAVIATFGLWSAYGGTSADNRSVCGVTTVGGDGRRINVQQYAGDNGLEFSLQKQSWAIPANTPVNLRIQFDQDQQVPSSAVGNGNQVGFRMEFDQSVPFMRALRNDRQIRVFFLSGNEPVWTGGLAGSGRAIDSFNDCRARLVSGPTQPYAGVSQPVAPPPPVSNSQPFGAPALPLAPGAPTPATPTPIAPPADSALPPLPQAGSTTP